MHKLILVISTFLLTVHISAQDMVLGLWGTGEENTVIETYQKDGMWYGKIKSSDNVKAKIGKDILQDFTDVGGTWRGKLFAAKKGKLVDAEVTPSIHEMKIKVTVGMFNKKLTWKKIEE